MTETEKDIRVAQVIGALYGADIMDAVEILANALDGCKNKDLCILPIAYIGKLIESVHGRSALIKIEDDCHLSLSIAANGVEQKLF